MTKLIPKASQEYHVLNRTEEEIVREIIPTPEKENNK
jgi:hypothetical protein